MTSRHIKFRNDGDEILTLWVDKELPDGWVLGWCPERQNHIAVHPENIVDFSDIPVQPEDVV